MDGRFLDAFTLLPRQRVVCGYQTKPFCLRHRLVLTALKSPFVEGKTDVLPSQVLIAAKVLSSLNMAEMMSDKPSEHDLEQMEKMLNDPEYYLEQMGEIYAYINEQNHWPTFWNKGGKGKDKGIPWVLAAVCGLVSGGVSLEEAWTMPESQAVWMQAAFAVSKGSDVEIVSDADLAAQKRLEEYIAKQKEQQNV